MAKRGKRANELTLGLSNTELKILALSLLALSEPLKIDWDKLAQKGGYTVASARTTWNSARRKLVANMGEDDTPRAPRKTRNAPATGKRKRGDQEPKKPAAQDGTEEEESPNTTREPDTSAAELKDEDNELLGF